ncbi:hypothetical protein CC78DRAFT_535031 [Lojkania enalia]|uniref:DNA repair protein Rad26 n=1 Tax=Lojkania enalia TaxID=147567 RepID=A0A9P4K3Y0_9PLEO|nr:hypothetical protein CC78DRAFT_535031 [Didymosphaeria enalia]
MADMDEDDDFSFSDHDLDDLPANALQQLETTAILSTQQPASAFPPESGYGLDDADEVINLDDEAAAPPQQPHRNQHQRQHQHSDPRGGHGYHGAAEAEEDPMMPPRSQVDINQLLLRIKKLNQDNARLNRDLQSERSKALAKSGEVDTVRRRFEAATRDNDRRIQAIQQSHAESLAKQKAELDKIRREREQAQTNNLFLEHDLAREADKAKQMKKTLRGGVVSKPKPASPVGTPKRQKSLPFRDGFDDEDIVMASPTKNKDKPRAATPKQAGKRKRQVADQSPIPALQLSEPRERPKSQERPVPLENRFDHAVFGNREKDDHRFKLLNRLVNHRPLNGQHRVLEALAQFSFPSQPEKKLSSMVYDELSSCSVEQDVHAMAVRICHVFLAIWDQCLEEQFYSPLHLVVDAVQFVLACEPSKTASAITERAIPPILSTITLVAEPIAWAARSQKPLADLFSSTQRKICADIDVLYCLDLLYSIATSCIASQDAIIKFWRSISPDLPLVILQKTQPLPQIILMMRILSTSALTDTLGVIAPEGSAPDDQARRENDIIERLSWLLTETLEPFPDPSTPDQKLDPYSPKQLLDLRIDVLRLLTTFSISESGSSRLIHHRHCVGRLIKYLDSCLSSLYSQPLFPTQSLTITSINLIMKLIYHLITSHPDIDVKSKLGVIQGGEHKYLVALARLAFSDGLVLEQGIDEEVVDAAHAILDEGLSLEEGEGLVRVFSSGNST